MDPHLQAYLSQPPPRPRMHDPRYGERALLWQFPLGAAFTGGAILAAVAGSRREWLAPGLVAWIGFSVAAYLAARLFVSMRQRLYRTGTFTEARVLEHAEHSDGEDVWLRIVLGVELDERPGEYREAPRRSISRFRMSLTSRWFESGTKRFDPGSMFPILVSMERRTALVFIDDEAIDAAMVMQAAPVD